MSQLAAVPPLIADAWTNSRATLLSSGRLIDEEFVKNGFSAVKALIEFKEKVYGIGTYNAYIEAQSGPEAFEQFRARNAEVMDKVRAARGAPLEERERVCESIMTDPKLPDPTKDIALSTLCETRRRALFEAYVPEVRKAEHEEQNALCKICEEPGISLRPKNAIDLRKEVYNAVMADAFGAIGFEPQKSKKGLQSFAKELTKDFSLFIEADPATFERDFGNEAISPLRYWPTIAFDGVAYLGATNKKDKSRHITFLPIMNCVAATRLQGYDDTRSLEVMIRGQALWHKLAIGPLERAILELS